MYCSDKLIYIQLHKTGCTHIASLLSSLMTGKQVGKHSPATADLINSENYFIASIRNPWDWYLSLWTFGVQGEGALRYKLTNKDPFKMLRRALRDPKKYGPRLPAEVFKKVEVWRQVYAEADDVEAFRKWLKLILDPRNAHLLGESYCQDVPVDLCGFMTYRYLYLFCANLGTLSEPGGCEGYSSLQIFEKNNCYIDAFIRQEALEEDFCAAVDPVHPLNAEARREIYQAKKTNTSVRMRMISEFYDEASIELVRNRDRLIIEKFNYSFPH